MVFIYKFFREPQEYYETLGFQWLTCFKKLPRWNMDITVIQQLVEWRVPEIQAKNALLITYCQRKKPIAFEIFTNLNRGTLGSVSATRLLHPIRHWPELKVIDEIVKLGE